MLVPISMMTVYCSWRSASSIENVGEAAKAVTPEFRAKYPGVEWSSAARMRDRVVHHYFQIDLDIVWSTVSEDFPMLLAALRAPDS